MQLYNLTLQKATNINHAVHGNYSGQKQQEIAVSRGTVVEILKEGFLLVNFVSVFFVDQCIDRSIDRYTGEMKTKANF